jgi:hypothetical protein
MRACSDGSLAGVYQISHHFRPPAGGEFAFCTPIPGKKQPKQRPRRSFSQIYIIIGFVFAVSPLHQLGRALMSAD